MLLISAGNVIRHALAAWSPRLSIKYTAKSPGETKYPYTIYITCTYYRAAALYVEHPCIWFDNVPTLKKFIIALLAAKVT